MDTGHHSESGGDTEHENVSRYLYLGWDTAHSNQWGICILFSIRGDTMFKYLYCGGDTAQNPKTEDWGAGWLDPSFKLIDGTECGKKMC